MGRKTDTVLFDYDGTIMDTNDLINNSWRYTFQQIEGRIPPDEVIMSTYGEVLGDTMRHFFGGDEETVNKNIQIYRSYHNNHYDEEIHLFPGVKKMLEDVKNAGYTTALVTSRLSGTTFKGLKEFGIYDLFDAFVTADDTDVHKPEPEPVLMALEKLGKKPEQAAMLGDSWFDMECARRAGVIPVLVGWSIAYKYRKNKSGGKPDYTIDRAEDLLPLLERINGTEAHPWE